MRKSVARNSIVKTFVDQQHEEMSRRFHRLRELPTHPVAAEFEESNRKIDDEVKIPLNQRLKLVSIEEKNEIEKLAYFNQKVFLGRLRKRILFFKG